MISYELAKKLKDAGFFQAGDGNALILHDIAQFESEEDQSMAVIPWCQYVHLKRDGKEVMYAPTLSELIEACGEDFDYLKKMKDEWRCDAYSRNGADDGIYGSTPEEAVAKLWLNLHTPK